MIRRLLPVAFVLLLFASRAQAAPINLLLTVNIYPPSVGPPETSFSFRFFQSASNGWPFSAFQPTTPLASGGGGLLPGVTQFNVSFDAANLDNAFFSAYGGYFSPDPSHPSSGYPINSLYAAEPPTGHVPDVLVYGYGPPWIPLANLGNGISGDLYSFYGVSRGPIGSHDYLIGTYQLAPVPEPTSLLLFGSGLVAVATKKYRQSKALRRDAL